MPYQVHGGAATGTLTGLTVANTPAVIAPAASLSDSFGVQPIYDTDLRNLGSEVWARFTEVPAPGGLALLASGLAALLGGARRRRRARPIPR